MCGIVGYVGSGNATEVLFDGLARLEYRGYDSTGVACLIGDELVIRKRRGRLQDLARTVDPGQLHAHLGIGHTRWATHGAPSDQNAHPHRDCLGRLAVVHNGIIENFETLRAELIDQGHQFNSSTDSEVIAHLVERELDGDLGEAVRRALARVEGSFAVALISASEPGRLVCARRGSPLIIAHREGPGGALEGYVASDIPALLPYAREVLVLEDDEVADVDAGGARIEGLKVRRAVRRELLKVEWDLAQAERGGAPHFMLKEIREQPVAVGATLAGRVQGKILTLPELPFEVESARALERVQFVACGTSYHASLVGRALLERLARLPSDVDVASEYRYRQPVVNPRTLVMGVSQSGETADTLAAATTAREAGVKLAAVCNVVGSALARTSDHVLYTQAGPEISVASTKAFTTQIVALYLMALRLGHLRGHLTAEQVAAHLEALAEVPERLQAALPEMESQTEAAARRYADRPAFLFVGRGLGHPIALEGALKLKEVTYLTAEGYPAGELKHGPIALVAPGVPVVALGAGSRLEPKMVSNLEEVRARGAEVIVVASERERALLSRAAVSIGCPSAGPAGERAGAEELVAPLYQVPALQLLAYHVAVARGCDVDRPRNLAKSVTVE
jgi:glucosamine--fructose-6-phosphate aminotransferase (isomerizing)